MNDAVARIISVKLALGVAKQVKSSVLSQDEEVKEPAPKLTTEYEDSLTAVHESLVLLKNSNSALPIDPNALEYVVLVGERIININGLARN